MRITLFNFLQLQSLLYKVNDLCMNLNLNLLLILLAALSFNCKALSKIEIILCIFLIQLRSNEPCHQMMNEILK